MSEEDCDNYLATDAELCYPSSVFVSPNKEVFTTDCFNHRIRKVLANGKIVTIAGTGKAGFNGDNELATSTELSHPSGVFISSKNEVYFADQFNHRIRKIREDGKIVTIAGNGIAGFSGDNGLAINAQINSPNSVFVTELDEIYFADCSNNRVRKILQNGIIITIAGCGKGKISGDHSLATNVALSHPSGVFVSSKDEVYFTENRNHLVRKVLKNGNIITIAGTGHGKFRGDNGPAIEAQLWYPSSVFVSENEEVFISDTTNKRIRKISQHGVITTIVGCGEGDGSEVDDEMVLATDAHLNVPTSVFVSEKEIYIADKYNNKIRKLLQNGKIVTVAGCGGYGYSGDSPFDFSQYPHIGKSIPKSLFKNMDTTNLKIDRLFDVKITCLYSHEI